MKKNLLFAVILTVGLVMAGCGSTEENKNTLVKEDTVQNGSVVEMEADAPKTSTTKNVSNQQVATDDAVNNAANGTTNSTTNNTQAVVDNTATAEISEEKAKEIALADAGISEADVKGIRIEKDKENGRQVYDIDFYAGDKEYDYDIDLYTGEIVGRDYEIEDDFSFAQDTQNPKLISQEEALAIVLKKVEGAVENDVEIELDKDDGRWTYEGEIHYNQKEYEFEVNAENGNILEWKEESIYD